MDMDRRTVLGLAGVAGMGVWLAPGLRLVAAPEPSADRKVSPANEGQSRPSPGRRWAMLIDVNRCGDDCTLCTTACRKENNVPTFNDPQRDIHWIRKVELEDKANHRPKLSIPMLCNHCENPPCVHVCPTSASFVRQDGLVLIDMHRCIGCRYCIIACPYKARSLVYHRTTHAKDNNPKVPIRAMGVVEKCTFCVHRLDEGKLPACVDACRLKGPGSMLFGDLNDPDSPIAQKVRQVKTQTLRPDLGLNPQVYYQGL